MPVASLSNSKSNYLVMGRDSDRAPLLMIHGLAANLAFWMPAVQLLPQDRRMVIYDLRGHGRSSMPPAGYTPTNFAQDLHELVAHLGLDRFVLVAHSFGGSVALEYAQTHPECVAGLILADARIRRLQPAQSVREWPDWPRLEQKLAGLGASLTADDPEIGYRILTELARLRLRTSDGEEGLPKWVSEFFGHGGSRFSAMQWLSLIEQTTAWHDLMSLESFSVESLRHMTLPSLAVYGENSSVLATLRELQTLWPHLDTKIIPHAGHFFPLTKAKELADHMTAFLSRLPPLGAAV